MYVNHKPLNFCELETCKLVMKKLARDNFLRIVLENVIFFIHS